jgi:uncharacterized protein (DUF1015 family)
MKFYPLKGLRPAPSHAEAVASPPYDVINSSEARELAKGNPWSFLHVIKPEIDLSEDVAPYSSEIYATAANNLQRMIQEGILTQDESPSLYVYRQTWKEHVQTGLVGLASVDDYDEDRIKKHEHTRQDKEDDRTRHVDITSANSGPVFLTYRAQDELDQKITALTLGEPDVAIISANVEHLLWQVSNPEDITDLQSSLTGIEAFYVADGHHRSASASRTRAARKARNPQHGGNEAYNHFLSVIFPHDQLAILSYNRGVHDLNGHDPTSFMEAISGAFEVSTTDNPIPHAPGDFHLYLDGQWWKLTIRTEKVPTDDPVESLDVALLQNHLLHPVLGIGDPRKDKRIEFIGGIRGHQELERRVNNGDFAVAFSMYPTSTEQLINVADSGEVMPPKSTWFEPKLLSGLVVHLLDGSGPTDG